MYSLFIKEGSNRKKNTDMVQMRSTLLHYSMQAHSDCNLKVPFISMGELSIKHILSYPPTEIDST